MTVGSVLGVVAVIFALIGAFTPGVGLAIGWLALLIACLAALFGDRSFTVATVILSAVVFIVLTPSLWFAELGRAIVTSAEGGRHAALAGSRIGLPMSLVMLAAPITCIYLRKSGRLVFGAKTGNS